MPKVLYFRLRYLAAFSLNILAVVVLVRGRLWLIQEGYVYLAANFGANIEVLLSCT